MHAPAAGARSLFRRYDNRRLYSVDVGAYVSLDVLADKTRRQVLVIDAHTGADITSWAIASAKHKRRGDALREWARRLKIESRKS